MTADISVLPVPPSLLGEGPVWDAPRQCLWWVDILNGVLHRYEPQSGAHRSLSVGQYLGAVALRPDGRLFAALHHGFALLDPDTGALEMRCDPESHLPGNRFNDGKCDPAGRFWAGTMALDESAGAGNLYMLDETGQAHLKIPGVTISNGMAWSHDSNTFYYIDTPTFEVWAYDFDVKTGKISNKRTAIVIPPEHGYPDGMCIAADGMLWIAHWDGWQVTRWDPLTGAQLGAVRLPAARITSCVFAGADLYVTSARVGLSDEALAEQEEAGKVWRVGLNWYF